MKLLLLIAAPLAIAATAMPAQAQDRPAPAPDRVVHTTTVTRHVASVHRDDRSSPRPGHWKKVCKTRWTHHKKIRTCKNVRVRW